MASVAVETVPPTLTRGVWIQPTGFGPDVYAGQVLTSDGRQVHSPHRVGFDPQYLPVRVAPKTEAGLARLAQLLAADLKRAAA